jgi:signal transduction histidine kinase
MLLALHAALAWEMSAWWARALLLAHFGLFLMWQPVWRGERAIDAPYAVLVVGAGLALAVSNSWWLVAVWLAVLVGLIGGAVPGTADRTRRAASILAAVYLLAMLLIWVVPQLIEGGAPREAAQLALVRYGLPFLPLAIGLLRVDPGRDEAQVPVDLFYSMLLFLLVLVLILGSLVVRHASGGHYAWALAQTLFVIAALLVSLSWLWNPRGGFAGIGQMLSRYLLSLGLPFERWVQHLAELAQAQSHPERFLEAALRGLLTMPWATGVEWRSIGGSGELGRRTGHSFEFGARDVTLRVFTRWRLSPAMLLHMKLLTQIVAHFYRAKHREQIERLNAYAQAIHETGARLTHDVKNLLQSLQSLCAAAETAGAGEAAALQALMRRQLPQIAQRLNGTLEKLRAPRLEGPDRVAAQEWWQRLVQRHSAPDVAFHLEGDPAAGSPAVPGELFDSVADNLIGNALGKRTAMAALQVSVTFSPANGGQLDVCDSGAAVADSVAARLFGAPVASAGGLGVGLYHASRQAAQLGYTLTLVANEQGRVCFRLERGSLPQSKT